MAKIDQSVKVDTSAAPVTSSKYGKQVGIINGTDGILNVDTYAAEAIAKGYEVEHISSTMALIYEKKK